MNIIVVCGVPQGSVLGPILFPLYVADLLQLIKRHQLHPHAFADDTQFYGFCQADAQSRRISNCSNDVSAWMEANRLQLDMPQTRSL